LYGFVGIRNEGANDGGILKEGNEIRACLLVQLREGEDSLGGFESGAVFHARSIKWRLPALSTLSEVSVV
jgi:hypothetical protein